MQKTVAAFSLLFGFSFLFLSCKKETGRTPPPPETVQVTIPDPIIVETRFWTSTVADSSLPSGEILMALTAGSEGRVFSLDQRGSKIRAADVASRVENFQKWVIGGKVRYSYFHSNGLVGLDGIQGTELGYQAVCDSDLNVLYQVALKTHGKIDSAVQNTVDVHEFILLGENHYISESYYPESPANIPDSLHPDPQARVAACIIQEVNNGQVVFQWDATDYPEFYAASRENNDFTTDTMRMDYLHLNSICIDSTDNNLIVSFRNLNQIIKIDRTTGAILWRLGGTESDFPLNADQEFMRQHYVRFQPGTHALMFLDNGLADLRAYSRILTFDLDETAHTVKTFTAWTVPDKFIQFAGSVQKIGDHYFIGGGSAKYALEADISTSAVKMRLNLKYASYRQLKY